MRMLACLCFLTVLAAPSAASAAPPPSTPRGKDASTLHGTRVADPYRWLEDGNAEPVQSWIAHQNARTDKAISAMPQGEHMNRRVRELAITSTTRSDPKLVGGTLFYLRETPPQPQPVLVAQASLEGKARVLVDLNKDGGGTAITAYWPSPDGRYLAYGTAEGGSELTTLHVLDVASGKKLTDVLPYAGGGTTPQALAWDADDKGFTYVRFTPPAEGHEVRQFKAALAHHRLGQPADSDAVVFGHDFSDIAEYQLLASPDGKRFAVLAFRGDGGPAMVSIHDAKGYRRVLGMPMHVRAAAWFGSHLALMDFADAPRGRILRVGDDMQPETLLPQRYGALQDMAPIKDGFLVVRSWGMDRWAEQYDSQARFVRRLPLPDTGVSIGDLVSQADSDKALISYQGWTQPTRWAVYDSSHGTLKTVFSVKPAADYSRVRVHQLEAVSADGTRVPVTVLADKDVQPSGHNPAILYGYGGFSISMAPSFLGARLAWIERGGVYAVANIRGGSEFGEGWHTQGQREDKQNVFDDFHAAAMALIESGWSDRDHLGIMGGSNGGLLMGTQIVQHPGDYRAAVSMVGIYDMLRHETDFANGRYNVTEYGSIESADQFKATLAYSPLQNVKPDTAYPAVLMTTGANDPRVAPWQSRKFAAALQNANSSDRPILLLTRMNAGHGIGAPFSQRVGNTAIALTFFAHELGLPAHPVAHAKGHP